MPDFLLEIGVEEIPDWMIDTALLELRTKFEADFKMFGGDAIRTDATPRRLILKAQGLSEQAPDAQAVVPGPYLSAGKGAGEGFAKKFATTVDKLATTAETKGERYVFHQLTKGQLAVNALAEKLPEIVSGLHFPKAMYWTGKGGVRFIRPIRWIVALFGDQVVPFEIAGVKSGDSTRGHRVLGSIDPVPVTIASHERILRDNGVIMQASERRARIESAMGSDVKKDDDLLGTLVYLTEFPTAIRGTFDPSYLELPHEILSTVMRHHQRYFSVLNPDGSLAPQFVAVTNTDGDPEGLIRQGNERVLRARFNDARFFWNVDQRKKLSSRVPDLAKVTFQAKLGSYKDKAERVVKLATQLASQTGADENTVSIAALLSKCDLTTDMVKEFTELQGVVGGLYAKAQGEGDAVAAAIYDHYKPVSMEDSIPRTLEGQIVSIADKLDTLRECFKIGMIPSGSKDPFALRRAAQGVVKILFEARLTLDLSPFVNDVPGLDTFIRERAHYYLQDVLGFPYDEVNAVMAAPATNLSDLADRLKAIHEVRATADFEPLAASFKRIKNILRQAQAPQTQSFEPALLTEGPEQELYKAYIRVRDETKIKASDAEKLNAIASLRPQVDLFFDKILVNDPDLAIRQNRLALLSILLTEFSTVADFSEIVTQGASAQKFTTLT